MTRNPHAWSCKRSGRWLAAGLLAAFFGCGNEDPTRLGPGTRRSPGPLRDTVLAVVRADTVFPVPVALGSSPVGQLGFQLAYTSHLLLAYSLPTQSVIGVDTLRLDTANLILRTDSLVVVPFRGRMRIRLLEVATAARGWSPDSALTALPMLEPDALARDTLLTDSTTVGRLNKLEFAIDLNRIDGYRAARDSGKPLDVNVAVKFEGFDPAGGEGFLEVRLRDVNRNPTTQLIGFSNDDANAIATVRPARQTAVVLYDATYDPGTKLVVSDGFRQHTFLQFAPFGTVLPESALVHRAELRLTMVDSTAGTSFGASEALGIIVPADTTVATRFSRATNTRPFEFSTRLVTFPGIEVPITVTAYAFAIQERISLDRGLILRLANEGTKARHFEFYGGAAPDSLRPRLHLVYSLPSGFEGDR